MLFEQNVRQQDNQHHRKTVWHSLSARMNFALRLCNTDLPSWTVSLLDDRGFLKQDLPATVDPITKHCTLQNSVCEYPSRTSGCNKLSQRCTCTSIQHRNSNVVFCTTLCPTHYTTYLHCVLFAFILFGFVCNYAEDAKDIMDREKQ